MAHLSSPVGSAQRRPGARWLGAGLALVAILAAARPVAAMPEPLPEPVAIPAPPDPRAYALAVLGPVQFACLDAIVMRESRWDPTARNPRSGAFGIPQALHGLTSLDPIVQVDWMIRYIAERPAYGTPCRAWAFWQRNGWY